MIREKEIYNGSIWVRPSAKKRFIAEKFKSDFRTMEEFLMAMMDLPEKLSKIIFLMSLPGKQELKKVSGIDIYDHLVEGWIIKGYKISK